MKRTVSLALAALLAASAVSCAAPSPAQTATSSDLSASVAFLNERVADTSDIILGDADTAASLGIDMSSFEASGYTIRRIDGQTAILGKTADGVDRAVRDFVKHQSDADYTVTVGEGYRIDRLTVCGNDIADYVIVLPPEGERGNVPECTAHAADVLRDRIASACGVKLPITTAAPADGKCFELIPGDADLGDDGFETTVSAGRVTVRGGEVRGCLYGVYDFLEKVIGYRFLTAWETYLYESDRLDIPDGYHDREVPTFTYRCIADTSLSYKYALASFVESTEYASMRKANGNVSSAIHGYAGVGGVHHSMTTWIPSHPGATQPCFTDPDVADEAIDNIRAELEAADAAGTIGKSLRRICLGQSDTGRFCDCKNCTRLAGKYGTRAACVVTFANTVAEAFEEDFPEIVFGIYAYWGAIIPPRGMELHPNLYVEYCIYGFCDMHPLDGSKCDETWHFQEDLNNPVHSRYLAEWGKLTDRLMVRIYGCDFWDGLNPFMNVDDILGDHRFLADTNVCGIYTQCGQTQLIFDELYAYLHSICQWDPYINEADYDAAIREFMKCFYGDGWESLYEYLMLGCREKNSRNCNDSMICDWTAENYDYLCSLFDEAMAGANSAAQTDRIDRLFVHVRAQRVMGAYESEFVNGTPEQREYLQDLWYAVRDDFKKYGIVLAGLESEKKTADIDWDLSVDDPRLYNSTVNWR